MTVLAPVCQPTLAQRPQAILKPAAPAPAADTQPESQTDKLLRLSNYGVGGAGSIAGLVAIPSQVAKYGPSIAKSAIGVGLSASITASSSTGLVSAGASMVAKSSALVAKHTPTLATFANATMRAPVIGRVFCPNVAKIMTDKVLPAANAVGAGLAILDNSNRFYKAHQANNKTGQIVAGAQIALNGGSAVLGYLPGSKAQWVSAGLGLAGLGLEMAHQFTGLGK